MAGAAERSTLLPCPACWLLGRVELPPLQLFRRPPAPQVHLDMPYVVNTCKALGVEHARALVGFARNRFPQVEGVVVWEEDQQRVVDAYLQAERLVGVVLGASAACRTR